MEPSRLMCCRCGRPLVCTEDLARWLESVMRDGARVYCSLACSAASETLERTGDVALVGESEEPQLSLM
ncbi:MAG TPA: hypothetical protein VGG91_20170 [Myxococcaceae bacterium]|jgi:hypothetical protein